MKKEKTYEQAVQQLETIVRELEQGQLSIDQLINKTREAQTLIDFCQKKLTEVEKEIQEIMPEDDKMPQFG